MAHIGIISFLTIVACFFMALSIGANDVANSIGTSVGSRALNLIQALIIAAIFESLGALLIGNHVILTLGNGMLDTVVIGKSHWLAYGMLSALLAATLWIMLANFLGWPVSTTQSIVGALIGYAIINFGVDAIYWRVFISVILYWFISPLIAGSLAYILFSTIQQFIFRHTDPQQAAIRYVPIYVFLTTFVLVAIIFFRTTYYSAIVNKEYLVFLTSGAIAIVLGVLSRLFIHHQLARQKLREKFAKPLAINANIESIFNVLMVLAACMIAFAHGSNDIANAVAPAVVIMSKVVETTTFYNYFGQMNFSLYLLILGTIGIVSGLTLYSYRVIETVGSKIVQLTSSRAFCAQLAAAVTVIVFSCVGVPVSTTQILVGAILGVGFAGGMQAIRLRVVGHILVSWIVTLPVSGLLSAMIFYLLKIIFS